MRQATTSLRTKLLLFTAALVLVPGVLLALIAERSSSASLERVIGRQLAREAGHTAERLSALLRAERETLESFARQDLMREIRVADIDKRVSVALTTLRDGSPARMDYHVMDAGDRIVASSDPARIGGRERAAPGIAGPAEGAAGRELRIATPIPDPDDGRRRLGTLLGVFDWERLTAVTDQVRQDLAAQGIAADVLVVRADDARAGGGGAGWIVGRAALAPELPDWELLVQQPRSDALAPARRSSRRLALAMGVALVAALALATFGARRVVRPLSELTRALRGLSPGKASALHVPVRTEDEVGTLARAFNEMASELDRAQRELVEAEKFAFVGELAAGVAHEIRTALNVLGSSAQILERSLPRETGPEAAELAEMIRAEVARLAGIVNDLLTLARGRPVHREPGLLSEPLFRAADFVAPQAREKGVRLERSAPPHEPVVAFDSELVYQTAVNLLVNAIQALGHGGCIELRVLEEKDGQGGFEVRDDGPGIPDELRERIFDPFVTSRAGGVGLGLTFVKRVVHDHRGTLSLESEPGAGTGIRIRMPVAAA